MMLSVSAIKFERARRGIAEKPAKPENPFHTVHNVRALGLERYETVIHGVLVLALGLIGRARWPLRPSREPSRCPSERPRGACHASHLWGLMSLTFSGSDCMSGNSSADSLAPPSHGQRQFQGRCREGRCREGRCREGRWREGRCREGCCREGQRQTFVAGRIRQQGAGAQAADRPWMERQLAQSSGAPPHAPRVGARVVLPLHARGRRHNAFLRHTPASRVGAG